VDEAVMSSEPYIFQASADAPLLEAERRASVRFPCPTDSFYCSLTHGPDICLTAQVRDLSPQGIGLVFTQKVARGTILSVELPSRSQQLPCFLLASVSYSRVQADGTWLTGCQFGRPLTDAEFQTLQ
jgi:hypothetical protein